MDQEWEELSEAKYALKKYPLEISIIFPLPWKYLSGSGHKDYINYDLGKVHAGRVNSLEGKVLHQII